MKVKVGDRVYDAKEEPVMVILSTSDKENIKNMVPEATKYCCAPDGTPVEDMKAFMQIPLPGRSPRLD